MEELLPYYERELGFLRSSSRDFAERYPKIAARLGLSGETCEDCLLYTSPSPRDS